LIVVDASSVVDLLLHTGAAERIESRLCSERRAAHAPHLLDPEVLQAIRGFVLTGEVTEARARLAVTDLGHFGVRRWSQRALRERVWALRHNVSPCDATYVALAERLGCRVLTRDGPLSRTPRLEDRFELI